MYDLIEATCAFCVGFFGSFLAAQLVLKVIELIKNKKEKGNEQNNNN